eukprot:TRINITY_DN21801_c0_g1_i1.p2 TRINITY_DN21801_c0_g1~~TRINITY_DN21801_c0_g1_i1.p2  ORF type:complete len:119 (+),score=12.93 TRINITY_DN21801_c0_g1_i1:149-505(+)
MGHAARGRPAMRELVSGIMVGVDEGVGGEPHGRRTPPPRPRARRSGVTVSAASSCAHGRRRAIRNDGPNAAPQNAVAVEPPAVAPACGRTCGQRSAVVAAGVAAARGAAGGSDAEHAR